MPPGWQRRRLFDARSSVALSIDHHSKRAFGMMMWIMRGR
jgi:hypothetical protein